MIPSLPVVARLEAPWRDPLAVAAGVSRRSGALALHSPPDETGALSWVGAEPDVLVETPADDGLFDRLRASGSAEGVVGLAAYDAGARVATGPRPGTWPDLILARYPSLLRFDHARRAVAAVGLGRDATEARARAETARGWLQDAVSPVAGPPPAAAFAPEASPEAYRDAVADVVARIAAGELFQANIARAWSGTLKPAADPFEVFMRLGRGRASSYGAFWRIGDRALVSNSPELFLTFDPADGRIETRPIKGTRARHPDPDRDAALARELAASAKDRAENLMIVDLMRNDLSRAAEPGSVRVERLFDIRTLPTVHHLVSTVVGTARPGTGPAEILEAAFPPGSITGAPKHQAMKVIAGHEPPRGPWCGSLFLIDDTRRLTASVLIRTAGFERGSDGTWRFRTLAGAGIVADSDPVAELAETGAKILALREALIGDQGV